MNVIDACPEPEVVRRFALGWLSQEQSLGVEEHLAACPRCSRVLHATEVEGDDLIQRFASSPRSRPSRRRPSMPFCRSCAAPRPPGDRLALPGRAAADAECTPCTFPARLDPREASLPIGFLGPPAVPGDLGELGGYRIKRILGAGGMGIVLLAEDPRLHRDVAVKVIQPIWPVRPTAASASSARPRIIAAIEHDNIVAIHRVDEHNGVLYLAMPLLRGESLESRLNRVKGPLPLAEVLQIGRETAAALAAAHARGIFHRDVKPGNIWLGGASRPVRSGFPA